MKTISLFGLVLALLSLPMFALAVILSVTVGTGFTLFATGLVVGAAGLFFIVLGILLKLASLLFRQ